ncbi:carbohydrate ABC transporter permease [Acholeplasma granularum]|uniref:carbohydrate ABC transporter permease n=1 Tax=Acholeplasma granularum TaxID=264635 RepID=UPI00046E7D6E|nr:carbohydrate ABC transporter permease [Acholeplasma granularum]
MNKYDDVKKIINSIPDETNFNAYSPVIKELTPKELKGMKVKKRIQYILKIINYLLILLVGVSFIYPFVWMFIMSVRSQAEAILFDAGLWVNEFHWNNYLEAWNRAKFSTYLGNSITYAVLVMGLQYIFIVPAAYAFARMKFKGNKLLFAIKQLGMMLPAEATLIPVYFFYSKLGLVDTWTGLVLPSLISMFGIYMFTNQFKTIPQEIIDSARMDKAKNRTIMLRIMVPMIFPVFITHLLLTFISNWNDYYWVLVMTNSEALKTLPVAVRGLLKADGIVPPWHIVMAGNMMQLAPILVMYILANSQMKRAMIGGRKINFGGKKNSPISNLFSKIKNIFTKTKVTETIKEVER